MGHVLIRIYYTFGTWSTPTQHTYSISCILCPRYHQRKVVIPMFSNTGMLTCFFCVQKPLLLQKCGLWKNLETGLVWRLCLTLLCKHICLCLWTPVTFNSTIEQMSPKCHQYVVYHMQYDTCVHSAIKHSSEVSISLQSYISRLPSVSLQLLALVLQVSCQTFFPLQTTGMDFCGKMGFFNKRWLPQWFWT